MLPGPALMSGSRLIRNWSIDDASVNQMLPSGPAEMPPIGTTPWSGNSVTVPSAAMLPIPPDSVNQTNPSGPRAIPRGRLFGLRAY